MVHSILVLVKQDGTASADFYKFDLKSKELTKLASS